MRLLKSSHARPDNSADKHGKYGGSSSQKLKSKVTDNSAWVKRGRLMLTLRSRGIFSTKSALVANLDTLQRPARTARPSPAAAAALW